MQKYLEKLAKARHDYYAMCDNPVIAYESNLSPYDIGLIGDYLEYFATGERTVIRTFIFNVYDWFLEHGFPAKQYVSDYVIFLDKPRYFDEIEDLTYGSIPFLDRDTYINGNYQYVCTPHDICNTVDFDIVQDRTTRDYYYTLI